MTQLKYGEGYWGGGDTFGPSGCPEGAVCAWEYKGKLYRTEEEMLRRKDRDKRRKKGWRWWR